MDFEILAKIFKEFKTDREEETPFGVMAPTDGGFLSLAAASGGGTLCFYETRPLTARDFGDWTAKAIVDRHCDAFIIRDYKRPTNAILALQSRFEFYKNQNRAMR